MPDTSTRRCVWHNVSIINVPYCKILRIWDLSVREKKENLVVYFFKKFKQVEKFVVSEGSLYSACLASYLTLKGTNPMKTNKHTN